MSEVELLMVNSCESCTMYTTQFISDDMSEFDKYLQKFERLLKQEVRSCNVEITEKEIITDKNFEL